MPAPTFDQAVVNGVGGEVSGVPMGTSVAKNSTFVIVAPPTPVAVADIVVLAGAVKFWFAAGAVMLTVGFPRTVMDRAGDCFVTPKLSVEVAVSE